jgi:gas vesicle protein
MFWGFILGAIGGAAYTLLNTPRSGKELRDEIMGRANQLVDRGQHSMGHTWQTVDQTAYPAWNQAPDFGAAVRQQAEAAAAQAENLAESAQREVSDAADAIGDSVDKAADDLID